MLILVPVVPVHAYKILYAEQFYELYHRNFYMYPEDINENIWFLEKALNAAFANPLNALATVETTTEWRRYRYLFKMHVNIELVEQYRLLASKYDKRAAYFYNAPFRKSILDSLRYAESYYETALYYWDEALKWSAKAWELSFINLDDVKSWEDDNYRIEHFELDYGEYVENDLQRLRKVRSTYEEMDASTY